MSGRGPDGRAPRKKRRTKSSQKSKVGLPFSDNEDLPPTDPKVHYQISHETRHPIQLSTWLGNNKDDPALLVSLESSILLETRLTTGTSRGLWIN